MSRSLSAPTSTAAGKIITQPGYLIQLGFSFVYRFSSRGQVTWNSLTWTENNVQVGALQEAPNGNVSVTVNIGNTDRTFGAACLNEPPQEKPVSIWAFYEGAVAAGDPVQIFGGVIESVDSISEASVALRLSSLNLGTLFVPRQRITRATGFNRLSPAGRVIQFNGVRYELVGTP